MTDESVIVHVRHNGMSPWRNDDAARDHGGEHVGSTEHGGVTHHAYRFAKARHATKFYAHIQAKGEHAHVTQESRPVDADLHEVFDDVDEACAWAHEAADATGLSYSVSDIDGTVCVGPLLFHIPEQQRIDTIAPNTKPTNEASIKRRSFSTRHAANRKRSLTTMDHNRRKVARTAKLWRMRNKSRIKGYQSVYDRPTKKFNESWLAEAKATLDAAFKRLSKSPSWVSEGWDRARILTEIDPSFVHHAEHYDRLLHGGDSFPGGGGLRWGGMVIDEHEAVLRVMGSFEYKPDQTIYQQTIRFANYRRVAEDTELTWPEKARLLLTKDNLKIHCDCDSYRFWHQHAATLKGFALVPENREAPVNNPAHRGGCCKHLDLALRYIGGQAMRMASEMKQHHEGQERQESLERRVRAAGIKRLDEAFGPGYCKVGDTVREHDWTKQITAIEHADAYDVWHEKVTMNGHDHSFDMASAVTKEGAHYIGEPSMAKALAEKGIKPELAQPTHTVCSVGKSSADGKWYGWSHRAMHGFGVGDEAVEFYPTGTKRSGTIKTDEEARAAAVAFADSVS